MNIQREFHHLAHARYRDAVLKNEQAAFVDDIQIHISDGERAADVTIAYYRLDGYHKPLAAELSMFGDSLWALPYIADLVGVLAVQKGIQPDDLCMMLEALGYDDATLTDE